MEEPVTGGAARFRHRNPPSASLLLGTSSPQTTATPPLELSEHDIFNTPSGGSSPSPTFNPIRTHQIQGGRSHHGILAALNDDLRTLTGSDHPPVFNHKASTSASLSSSSSTSPARSTPSRMIVPRRLPPPPAAERFRLQHQSAPVNVPMIPAAVVRRGRDLDDVLSEEEDGENDGGVMLPPHEVVAARGSPRLACSVLEGAGRTLKGRDLRQVRNAIWRRTGFID